LYHCHSKGIVGAVRRKLKNILFDYVMSRFFHKPRFITTEKHLDSLSQLIGGPSGPTIPGERLEVAWEWCPRSRMHTQDGKLMVYRIAMQAISNAISHGHVDLFEMAYAATQSDGFGFRA